MADFDIITNSLQTSLLERIEQIEDGQREEYIKRLEGYLSEIKKVSSIIEKGKNNRIKWSQLMDNSYSIINIQKGQQEQLTEAIINTYKGILNILTEIEIIDKVSFSISYISDNYQYARLSGDLSLKNFSLQKTAKSKGAKYAIRINQATLKEQIEAAKRNENFQKLNSHFQNYIQMFRDYEAQQINGTRWKINKGVLAETFERHLESQGGAQLFNDTDFESKGRRWTMYRQSSGSDPFWTGPDTKYAQVKTTKASLISNIDTVLNALYGMIQMMKHPDKLNEEILNDIFKQKNIENEISSIAWDALDDAARTALKEELSDLGFNELIIYTKQGKKKKKSYLSL